MNPTLDFSTQELLGILQRSRGCRSIHPIEITSTFIGWTLRQEIVWERGGAVQFNARMFAPSDERIVWLVDADVPHKWNQEHAKALTVWRMNPNTGIDGHPCDFPIVYQCREGVVTDAEIEAAVGAGD